MLDFPTWKRAWLWFITLACALAALPSLLSLTGMGWPAGLPDPKVNLGLDLAGGSHILLEADSRQVGQQRLDTMEESVRGAMRLASARGSRSATFRRAAGSSVSCSPTPPTSTARARR